MTNNPNVLLPYNDFVKLEEKANKADVILSLLGTEFPDDTCQIIAIKSVLGYVDPEVEEPTQEPEVEPEEPGSEEPDTESTPDENS